MNLRTPPTTPYLRKSVPFASTVVSADTKLRARWRTPVMVDEDAVTLRLRPLRWRDRMLPEVIQWAGAAACVAAVTGGWLLSATPSEAARIAQQPATAPMAVRTPESTLVLASARVETDSWAKRPAMPIQEEEDEVIILDDDDGDDDDDEDEEDEILVFDDALDGPASAAMASLHFDLGEPALALQYSMQAADADPNNAGYQQRLGNAYVLAGDHVTARQAFRRARRLRRE